MLNQTRAGRKPTQRAATTIVSLINFDSAHVQGTPRQTREIIATGLSQRFAELNDTADDLFMTEAVDKYPSCGRSNEMSNHNGQESEQLRQKATHLSYMNLGLYIGEE